jgi:mannose-6-phosphate isomerase-like protein (cupin superfamily)
MNAAILLRAEQSAGALGAIEVQAPAGWPGPPLHHHAFAEAFYVLEGELTFQLGDARMTAGAGEFVYVPGDAIHTLANFSGAPARYLLLCTPGGFERRFDASPSGPVPETIVVGDVLSR